MEIRGLVWKSDGWDVKGVVGGRWIGGGAGGDVRGLGEGDWVGFGSMTGGILYGVAGLRWELLKG